MSSLAIFEPVLRKSCRFDPPVLSHAPIKPCRYVIPSSIPYPRRGARFPAWGTVVVVVLLLILAVDTAGAQTADTARGGRRIPAGDSIFNYMPGGRSSRIVRDSAYLVWLYDKIRPIVRLREALLRDTVAWNRFLDSLEHTPEAIMRRNLAFKPEEWMPTPEDRARRDADIRRSQDWDFIHPPGIAYAQVASVPLASIGQMLGLTEDVSPRISYTVTTADNVSVKIYDLNARLIATLVNAPKKPGTYRMEWDMRDENGRRALSGDYIAEITIGTLVTARKRIVVP